MKNSRPVELPHLPLVSVIVPTRNRVASLQRCLNSIYESTYQEIEVTVVDDASTDGTPETVRRAFPRTRLIVHERRTMPAHSINEGIVTSKGDVIVVIDDDNTVFPEMLTQIVKTLCDNESAGFVGAVTFYLSKPDLIMYAGAKLGWFSRRSIFMCRNAHQTLLGKDPFHAPLCHNVFGFKRNVVRAIGLLDETNLPFMGYEAAYQLKAARYGYRVLIDPLARTLHDCPVEYDDSRAFSADWRLYFCIRSKLLLERYYDSFLGKLTFSIFVPLYFAYYVCRGLTIGKSSAERRSITRIILRAFFDGLIPGTPRLSRFE